MLKRDLIALCLLHLLSREEQYGYELLRRLARAFPDTQESAIYAILRGLSKDGYTQSFRGEISEGPVRKYYRLTDVMLVGVVGKARRLPSLCRCATSPPVPA